MTFPEPQETPRIPETVEAAQQPEPRDRRRLFRLRIILPFLILLAFLSWAYTTNYIPSESMLPTLYPGDHILTMRAWLAYWGGRPPSRGDIVTFIPPESALVQDGPPVTTPRFSRGEVWIKRVVGLPNETIWIVEGRILINGQPLPRQYYVGYPNLLFWRFPYASMMPLQLKADEVFVIGDNPDDSDDSRSWGPLKLNLIAGRFIRVLFREGPRGINRKRAEAENG